MESNWYKNSAPTPNADDLVFVVSADMLAKYEWVRSLLQTVIALDTGNPNVCSFLLQLADVKDVFRTAWKE
jgi:hypothetical protein